MAYDKAELISQVLKDQAESIEKARVKAELDKYEIDGAQQALSQFSKQVNDLTEVLENELQNPKVIEKLTFDTTLDTARAWVRRYLARIANMALQQAEYQQKQLIISEGKIQAAAIFRDNMIKQAQLEIEKAKRREEAALEWEAKMAEEAAAEAAPVEEPEAEEKPKKTKKAKKKKK